MRIRPVEQVVDRDPVADERAPALLLRVQAAKPLVARPPQGDAISRRESRRPADVAEAGGEDDERWASVATLACARERLRTSGKVQLAARVVAGTPRGPGRATAPSGSTETAVTPAAGRA